jgi:hypothetical protein
MGTRLEKPGLNKMPKIADKINENRLPFSILSAFQDAIRIVGEPSLGPGFSA